MRILLDSNYRGIGCGKIHKTCLPALLLRQNFSGLKTNGPNTDSLIKKFTN